MLPQIYCELCNCEFYFGMRSGINGIDTIWEHTGWTDGAAVLRIPECQGATLLEIRGDNGGMTYVTSAKEARRAA
jgi:hypothetical protein